MDKAKMVRVKVILEVQISHLPYVAHIINLGLGPHGKVIETKVVTGKEGKFA